MSDWQALWVCQSAFAVSETFLLRILCISIKNNNFAYIRRKGTLPFLTAPLRNGGRTRLDNQTSLHIALGWVKTCMICKTTATCQN